MPGSQPISEIHQAVEEELGEVESKFDKDNVAMQNNLHVSTGEKSSTGDEHKSGVIEVTTSTDKLYSQYATTDVSNLSAAIAHDSMHGTNYCSGAPGVHSAIAAAAAAVHAAAAAADPHAPAQ